MSEVFTSALDGLDGNLLAVGAVGLGIGGIYLTVQVFWRLVLRSMR